MKGLLLILVLVALSASLQAVEEFRQVEDGVFILGAKEEGESGVLPHPEKQWRRLNVQPDANVYLWPGGSRTIKSDSRNYYWTEGSMGLWDVLLAHYEPQRTAVSGFSLVQDISYVGTDINTINFIRVYRKSGLNAIATILEGGLGRNYVTIRLTSPEGEGFWFSIDIWGQ